MQTEPKNIVICCDGTGNEFGECNSNVVKIYTTLRVDKDQVAYYHPGLGTMGAPNETGWLHKKVSRIGGVAFGVGFRSYLGDAYQYLMEQYRDGDRIFLFGFSRGAYTVRALAGALHVYGLLCPGNEGHLPYLLRMYSDASRKAYAKNQKTIPKDPLAQAFKLTFSREVAVHFVGVWDTVSSVGWIYDPVKLMFEGQNPVIRTGRHAVSIDERRCFFQDNLWGHALPRSETPALGDHQQDIVQAWFPGVHSDVGGSYPQNECAPAQNALRWMIDEARSAGLQVKEEKLAAVFGQASAGLEDMSEFYVQPEAMCKIHESLTPSWWPLEFFPHKYFDENGKRQWQMAPWAHRREVPDGALLHPCVEQRLAADPKYQPKNLQRESIEPLGSSPIHLPHPEVERKLADSGFSVYRPHAPASQPVPGIVRAAAILAGIGLGLSMLRR